MPTSVVLYIDNTELIVSPDKWIPFMPLCGLCVIVSGLDACVCSCVMEGVFSGGPLWDKRGMSNCQLNICPLIAIKPN